MMNENTNVNAEMTAEEMADLIAKLSAENDALKKAKTKVTDGVLTLRVSAKGAVSIYGVGRWPVTLYASQVVAFFKDCKGGLADRCHQFILDNQEKGLEFKDGTKANIIAACQSALAVAE